ncbi:hypothetical protein SNEBB_003549 [Seison nebaliae]|nr:hypothetical protein SNEBB_003549 [Seison nebaliae]
MLEKNRYFPIECRLLCGDYRREENSEHIADSLESLIVIQQHIFSKLNEQYYCISKRRRRLDELIKKCEEKIELLKNNPKLLSINVSSMYPVQQLSIEESSFIIKTFKVKLMSEVENILEKKPIHRVFSSNLHCPIKVNQEIMKEREELFHFPVKYFKEHPSYGKLLTNKNKQQLQHRQQQYSGWQQKEMPFYHQVQNIQQFLLYNTTNIAYAPVERLQPIDDVIAMNTQTTTDMIRNDKLDEIIEAPQTITDDGLIYQKEKDNINYEPVLDELPDLDLPSDLGIGGDTSLFFEENENYNLFSTSDNTNDNFEKDQTKLPTIPNMNDSSTIPPAPRPPPSVVIPTPPSPPPPPPPPPPNVIIESSGNNDKSSNPEESRTNLLSAIRDFGGFSKDKMQPVKKSRRKHVDAESKVQPSSSGDMMTDLLKLIRNRGKAMSGKSDNIPDNFEKNVTKPILEKGSNENKVNNQHLKLPTPPTMIVDQIMEKEKDFSDDDENDDVPSYTDSDWE